ncbi:ornithine cyclodeaminase family protein [Vagococcus salmoninarum]|uniref:ornithine cyclodeaminase family protein n=1 Tax=Vagococcus salmoninarum TaxID=2739 RepID=UPI003F995378
MLVLTKADVEQCFSMRDAIEADKAAMMIYSKGQATVPLRTNLAVPEANGQSLYMPAYATDQEQYLGVKIVSSYPNNIEKGLPTIPATMVVLDPATGIVDALIDGTYLTQLRTGAIQGAATELMANADAEIGALIGTGGQAQGQLEAMLTVREFKEIRIFDVDQERAKAFAQAMTETFTNFKATFIPCATAQAAVTGADVITTVTTSKFPTFASEDVKAGAHINGVGAYTPEMKEVPREIIKKADCVIFDTMAGVLAEAGDFIEPLAAGFVEKSAYQGELGQLLLAEINGRQKATDITIFKTVGSAVLDVVCAQEIVNKARALGIGQEITL